MAKLPDSLKSIRGMSDHLPPQSLEWQRMERTLWHLAYTYGFSPVKTPVLEPSGLFIRGIGESTDIVDKEMYRFVDHLNGQDLALRPEGTASCVRAYFEHGLQRSGTQRWCYLSPMFRHERPQKGRLRQFHQLGLEIIGTHSVHADIELILFTAQLWKTLGIPSPRLEINSLGIAPERMLHRQALIAHWMQNLDQLDEDAQSRLTKNPLRLLDSKNPDMREAIDSAPALLDYLGEASQATFSTLKKALDHADIPYRVNPHLVRGLDYYNHTVFEWITDQLGAQGTICGGGRYDGLGTLIAGEELPACGLAIGLERLIALIPAATDTTLAPRSLMVAHEGGDSYWFAQEAAIIARAQPSDKPWQVVLHYEGGKWSNQIRKANDFPCRYIALLGEREREAKMINLKDLSQPSREPIMIPLAQWSDWLASTHS